MQVFSYSSFHKEGEVGEITAEALSSRDVRWAKIKPVKEPKEKGPPTGVPAEPGPDLGIEYRQGLLIHFVVPQNFCGLTLNTHSCYVSNPWPLVGSFGTLIAKTGRLTGTSHKDLLRAD